MATVCLCACSQQGSEGGEDVIFPKMTNFDYKSNKDVKLSSLFKDYRLVQLETNDSCLVGGEQTHMVKHNGIFYIRDNSLVSPRSTISKFDNNGRFIGNFNRHGQGPDEYPDMHTFKVLTRNEQTEIWVAGTGGIRIYDANTSALKKHVRYDGTVSDFKYVSDSAIVINTFGELAYQVMDINGKLRRPSMPRDAVDNLFSVIKFTAYQGNPFCIYGNSPEMLMYDVKSDSLYFKNLFPYRPEFVTIAQDQKYYEEYGAFNSKAYDNHAIVESSVRVSGKQAVFCMVFPNEPAHDRVLMLFDGEKSEPYCYEGPNASLVNDLFGEAGNTKFIWKCVGACESDEGFLFYINAEDYTTDEAHLEDNPVLLEVSGFKL